MQKVPVYFLLVVSCRLFGAASEKVGPFFPMRLQDIVDMQVATAKDACLLIARLRILGDAFPTKDNPLYKSVEDLVRDNKDNCNDDNRNALHYAFNGTSIGLIEMLREQGMRLDDKTKNGQTCLHFSVYTTPDMIEYALKESPKEFINLKDKCVGDVLHPSAPTDIFYKGRTALHYLLRVTEGAPAKTTFYEYQEADNVCKKITLFHAYGADLNVQDGFWGRTILHWSIYNPISVMATLLKLGADPNVKDKKKNTVLDFLEFINKRSAIDSYDEKKRLLLDYRARRFTTGRKSVGLPGRSYREVRTERFEYARATKTGFVEKKGADSSNWRGKSATVVSSSSRAKKYVLAPAPSGERDWRDRGGKDDRG
jgi:hypothetical protein